MQTPHPFSGRSAVRLARLLWEQEAPGSNPGAPTISTVRLASAWRIAPRLLSSNPDIPTYLNRIQRCFTYTSFEANSRNDFMWGQQSPLKGVYKNIMRGNRNQHVLVFLGNWFIQKSSLHVPKRCCKNEQLKREVLGVTFQISMSRSPISAWRIAPRTPGSNPGAPTNPATETQRTQRVFMCLCCLMLKFTRRIKHGKEI